MNAKLNTSLALFLTSLLGAGVAHAEWSQTPTNDNADYNYTRPSDQPKTVIIQPTTVIEPRQEQQQSVTQDNYRPDRTLKDEVLGITPELGALSYTNRNSSYTTRAMAGAGVDFNLIPLVSKENRDLYLGVSTGALYSHTGSDSSNFFGANAAEPNTDNSNLLFIPADVKLGVNMGESFRLSGHAGGNIIYRSVASAVNLGADSNTDDSLWRIYPNAGIDAEWQVGKSVALQLRPDLTFTSGTALFAATLGATILDL